MVYAKQMENGAVTALMTYDFEPVFEAESGAVIITAGEYAALLAAMQEAA